MDTFDVTTAKNVMRLNKDGIAFSTNGVGGPYSGRPRHQRKVVLAEFIATWELTANIIKAGILQDAVMSLDQYQKRAGKSRRLQEHKIKLRRGQKSYGQASKAKLLQGNRRKWFEHIKEVKRQRPLTSDARLRC